MQQPVRERLHSVLEQAQRLQSVLRPNARRPSNVNRSTASSLAEAVGADAGVAVEVVLATSLRLRLPHSA